MESEEPEIKSRQASIRDRTLQTKPKRIMDAISKTISTHCVQLLRVSKVASKLGYVTCQHVKLYYAQMQLGHKSSNTNVTWVISFQIEASLQYNLATDRTLGPADTGQASGLVRFWSRN